MFSGEKGMEELFSSKLSSKKKMPNQMKLLPENTSDQSLLLMETIEHSGIEIYVKSVDDVIKIKQAKHRIMSRTVILYSLVVPMSIIPIWLMGIFTFSVSGKAHMSQTLQLSMLGAIAVDFAGLYYVVTSDLFPKGSLIRRKDDSENDCDEGDS